MRQGRERVYISKEKRAIKAKAGTKSTPTAHSGKLHAYWDGIHEIDR